MMRALLVAALVLGASGAVPLAIQQQVKELVGEHTSLLQPGLENRLFEIAMREVLKAAPIVPRNVQSVEIFAGSKGITSAIEASGLAGGAFDRATGHPSEDICLLGGIIYAGILLLSVVPCGLAWMSPQCSMWLHFLSAGTTHRKRGDLIFGDERRTDVREANITASVVRWPLMLCDCCR
eukprot:13291544-Alexandrium_andersonii.AAC.1